MDKLTNTTRSPISKCLITRRSWQRKHVWNEILNSEVKKQWKFKENVSKNCDDDTVDGSIPNSSGESPITFNLDDKLKHDYFASNYGFRWYQVVIFSMSLVTYLADIISDAYLIYVYYKEENYYWSALTMILLILPAILMTSFSLLWYLLDRKVSLDPPRTSRVWALRILFHGLQLAPLVRSADAMYYGLMSKRSGLNTQLVILYIQLMLYEYADCAMLRMIECFTESAPQLLLQLYIILKQDVSQSNFRFIAQMVSCALSWLSLACALTHYQYALRSSRLEKTNFKWYGLLLFFLWKSSMLLSRLLSLAMCAVLATGYWFAMFLCIHWILATAWLIVRGTNFYSYNSRACSELMIDVVFGAVYCFDVMNLREGHSRLWYLMCYFVMGLENVLIALLWWFFYRDSDIVDQNDEWKFIRYLRYIMKPSDERRIGQIVHLEPYHFVMIVVCTFCFGIVMMIVYYLAAHPSGAIRAWIPCSQLFDNSEHYSPNQLNISVELHQPNIDYSNA